ncbi:hypothetical protein [Leucothrix pacifica]|uniref:Uncharacterized protein n=1 Tax=Leucothrix pacifica TaxID=1247513 RepID=A0A317CCN0_9GAMM|nr:hypothetical protein [Leucothrix pacifica]PWQ95103.1 hypothetical protein DKW60_15380 [Leucothrix pacifica]
MKYLFNLCLLSVASMISACAATSTTQETQGCRCQSSNQTSSGPAVLAALSANNTRILSSAMSLALNGTKVTLAPDVFTQSSQHRLQRNTDNPQGMPGLNGRLMGIPEIHRFSLIRAGENCLLRYEKTAKTYPLQGLKCQSSN